MGLAMVPGHHVTRLAKGKLGIGCVAFKSAIFSRLFNTEAPMRAEFLQKRLISAFFGFQWQNLAEILHLFKKYNNIGKVAVKESKLD